MADPHYSYVAIDRSGRRVRGHISAGDDSAAYAQLRRDGFSPITLKARRVLLASPKPKRLRDREMAEFLSGLSELLRAGADIRSALGILGARSSRPRLRKVSEDLAADIAGGEQLERAFSRAFHASSALVAPMVAAGEAAGDLPGGLLRVANVISSRLKLRDQLAAVLAYPLFVLASATAAVFVMLLYIVPSIAPLAAELGSEPPLSLSLMMAASDALRSHLDVLAIAVILIAGASLVAMKAGLLAKPIEVLLLDGPLRGTVRDLVFGGFSQGLGSMIAAGAPISDALRLATRTASMRVARARLEPVAQAVRQGEFLSAALSEVRGFPDPIARLTAIGEASNTLGEMLQRSGQMAEEAALRRIEMIGRIAGPALIVLLGGLMGVLMAGLLSGVSQMGQSALG